MCLTLAKHTRVVQEGPQMQLNQSITEIINARKKSAYDLGMDLQDLSRKPISHTEVISTQLLQ